MPEPLQDLLSCTAAAWAPGIGDPSVMGWVTVAAYLATAGLAVAAGWPRRRLRERVFWLGVAALLLLLGLNKQLDLQSALTAVARCAAQAQGWYEDRRVVQVRFIQAVLAASALVALGLLVWMRRMLGRNALAILGVVLLAGFVAIRAAGFHHMDRLIGVELGGVRMNWLLELGGIALIALNAAVRIARSGRR